MAKINILDSYIFNRIAAGEVVENPRSVVKELVENCIDAGSNAITIEIQGGGIEYIRVTDDGEGMSDSDLAMSVLPHATSKIASIDDLNHISTLGFRGEALASIASVARIKIISRQRGEALGNFIEYCYGTKNDSGCIGSMEGTSIIVEDLFGKIPARKKFLKKPSSEAAEITNLICRTIIANYNVSIKYILDGKTIFHSDGRGLQSALYTVYSKELFDNLVYIENSQPAISMYGFVSKPNYSKHNRSFQTLIVNGRYVYNNDITFVMQSCYREFMMSREFPVWVIFLDVPSDMVDVNVHPNKMEVKFVDFNSVKRLLHTTTSKAVNALASYRGQLFCGKNEELNESEQNDNNHPKSNRIINHFDYGISLSESANLQSLAVDSFKMPTIGTESLDSHSVNSISQKKEDLFDSEKILNYDAQTVSKINCITKSKPLIAPNEEISRQIKQLDQLGYELHESASRLLNYKASNDELSIDSSKASKMLSTSKSAFETSKDRLGECLEEKLFSNSVGDNNKLEKNESESFECNQINLSPELIAEDLNENPKLEIKILSKIFNTYIMLEYQGCIYLIDQHAAHERIIFDKLMALHAKDELIIQSLLLPYVFEVSLHEAEILEENLSNFRDLGFFVSKSGEKSFSIDGVPSNCINIDCAEFAAHLVLGLCNDQLTHAELIKDRVAMAACKAAVKGNDDLSIFEIRSLLSALEKTEKLFCPHGRPIMIKITKAEIEKWFKRIV